MKKITVIGAGNVGATTAQRIADRRGSGIASLLADVPAPGVKALGAGAAAVTRGVGNDALGFAIAAVVSFAAAVMVVDDIGVRDRSTGTLNHASTAETTASPKASADAVRSSGSRISAWSNAA